MNKVVDLETIRRLAGLPAGIAQEVVAPVAKKLNESVLPARPECADAKTFLKFLEESSSVMDDGQTGEYVVYGRKFKTRTFPSDEAANAYMADHEGWGVIGVKDGIVHVADVDDEGTEIGLGDAPTEAAVIDGQLVSDDELDAASDIHDSLAGGWDDHVARNDAAARSLSGDTEEDRERTRANVRRMVDGDTIPTRFESADATEVRNLVIEAARQKDNEIVSASLAKSLVTLQQKLGFSSIQEMVIASGGIITMKKDGNHVTWDELAEDVEVNDFDFASMGIKKIW